MTRRLVLPVLAALLFSPPAYAAEPPKLPFTLAKDTTVVTAPLLPDGTPDYVSALNEKYGKGVTPQNNALIPWIQLVGPDMFGPSYRKQAFQLLGINEVQVPKTPLQSFAEFLERTHPELADRSYDVFEEGRRRLLQSKDAPEISAYLEAQHIPLAAIPAAVARERWWIPVTATREGPLIWTALPAVSTFGDVGEGLSLRAMLRFRAGQWEGCLADLRTASRIATHTATGHTVLERLIAARVQSILLGVAGTIAASGRLSPAQCRQLAETVVKNISPPSFAEILDVEERYNKASMIVTIAIGELERFRPEVEGKDPDTDRWLKGFYGGLAELQVRQVDWDAVFRLNNEIVDLDVRAMNAPTYSQMVELFAARNKRVDALKNMTREELEEINAFHLVDVPELRIRSTNIAGRVIVSMVENSLENAGHRHFRIRMTKELVTTLLAAAEVRAESGRWPTSLDALNASNGTRIPLDMYAKDEREPVRYLLTPDGPLLYTIGRNGRDDQGINDGKDRDDDLSIGILPK